MPAFVQTIKTRTTSMVLWMFLLLTVTAAAQDIAGTNRTCVLPNKVEFGLSLNQYQKDFGLGIHVVSPYVAMKAIALKVGANLQWLDYFDGSEFTRTSYKNLQLGIRGRGVRIIDNVLVYGEGGVLIIFPHSNFSSQNSVAGGYGLFGFEFKPIKHMAYFIELGATGTGAIADKVEGKPIYSTGFLQSVGLRIGF